MDQWNRRLGAGCFLKSASGVFYSLGFNQSGRWRCGRKRRKWSDHSIYRRRYLSYRYRSGLRYACWRFGIQLFIHDTRYGIGSSFSIGPSVRNWIPDFNHFKRSAWWMWTEKNSGFCLFYVTGNRISLWDRGYIPRYWDERWNFAYYGVCTCYRIGVYRFKRFYTHPRCREKGRFRSKYCHSGGNWGDESRLGFDIWLE